MLIFTHKQSPDDASENLVKEIYKLYLRGLEQIEKADPTQKLPTGETIAFEIKRIKKHLKTLK
jgi:hypothetical protein